MTLTYNTLPVGNIRLWVKSAELWGFWFGDEAFIEENLVRTRDDGYPPTYLTAYAHDNGYVGYEVVFGPHPGAKCEWDLDLSLDELTQKIQEYRAKGWRPHIVNTHFRRNPMRFLAVFVENADGVPWDFSSSLTLPEYEGQLATRREQALVPHCLCSWTENGAVTYAVVWVQGAVEAP
jgi:hypothetical protein